LWGIDSASQYGRQLYLDLGITSTDSKSQRVTFFPKGFDDGDIPDPLADLAAQLSQVVANGA